MNNLTWPQRIAAAATHASWIISGVGAVWLPLLLWLVFQKNDFVRPHAKQALAWQVLALVFVCAVAFGTVLAGLADSNIEVAAAILVVAIVPSVIFPFIGTVKALSCEPYGYPLVKRFVETGI